MKLYVCWTTKGMSLHPCHKAHQALVDAGYDPEVIKVHGQGKLPQALQTEGRKKVYELTGSYQVPVLILDDETVINESTRIADWAKNNPAN